MSKRIEITCDRRGSFDGSSQFGDYCGWTGKRNGEWITLIVKDGPPQGFSFGGWGAQDRNRVRTGGPLVPGPLAHAGVCCTVIDNHGGSMGQIARDKANGLVIECESGDVLVVEGQGYRVDLLTEYNFNISGNRGEQIALVAVALAVEGSQAGTSSPKPSASTRRTALRSQAEVKS